MKKILFILLLIVVVLAVIPMFLPKTLHVEDEYVFDAPVERVFNHFNDLKKFTQFNAWSKKDPNMKLNFSSPAMGDGASYMWESNNRNLGTGNMSITDLRTNEFIDYNLDIGDMKGNTTQAIFQRLDDSKTKVIWSFDSAEAGYPLQVFNLLMKGTVQKNLKESFVNLDSILSKQTAANYPNQDINKGGFQIVQEPAKRLFGVLQQTTGDQEEMATAMNETLGFVHSYLRDANGLTEEEIGYPVVYWQQYNPDSNLALFYCGFFPKKDAVEKDDFEYVAIPAGKFLTTVHNGSYIGLNETYKRLHQFSEVNNLELSNSTLDVYLNDATVTDEKELKTQIFIPVLN